MTSLIPLPTLKRGNGSRYTDLGIDTISVSTPLSLLLNFNCLYVCLFTIIIFHQPTWNTFGYNVKLTDRPFIDNSSPFRIKMYVLAAWYYALGPRALCYGSHANHICLELRLTLAISTITIIYINKKYIKNSSLCKGSSFAIPPRHIYHDYIRHLFLTFPHNQLKCFHLLRNRLHSYFQV